MTAAAPAGSARRWMPAYIALGANLGDRFATIDAALCDLAALGETRLVARSPLYESPPMGPAGQPDYLNGVAGVLTRLSPADLLIALQAIESSHGRSRSGPRWGPRTLDLDLLVYADRVIDDDSLQVPHPGIALRAFVLAPLADMAPDLVVPGVGRVIDLLHRVATAGLRRAAPTAGGDGAPAC